MAQPQLCDTHTDTPAMFIIHNLENVEFMGLCPGCMTGFAIAWLQATAPEMIAKAEPRPRKPRARKTAAALADDTSGGESDASNSEDAEHAAAG